MRRTELCPPSKEDHGDMPESCLTVHKPVALGSIDQIEVVAVVKHM